MRDDVQAQAGSLIALLETKLAYLDEMLHSHLEKRHLLKFDQISEVNELIETDTLRSQALDLLEADITAARENISSLCGIPQKDFDHYFLRESGRLPGELRRITRAISKKMNALASENDTLLRELGEALKKTGDDIDGLRRLISLERRIQDPEKPD